MYHSIRISEKTAGTPLWVCHVAQSAEGIELVKHNVPPPGLLNHLGRFQEQDLSCCKPGIAPRDSASHLTTDLIKRVEALSSLKRDLVAK